MADSKTLTKVWYRPAPLGWTDTSPVAMKDRGTLSVGGGRIEFRGKKTALDIRDIRNVDVARQFGKKGRDFVNKWVVVEYGDGDTALFTDGGWLGWRGLFGGTRRLGEAIREGVGG